MYQTARTKHHLFFISVLMLLCLFLASCGSDQKTGGNNAIAGTWEMTEISSGTSQMSAEDYMKSADVEKVPVLKFETDGSVTLDVNGDSGTGTWAEENGNYSITYKTDSEEHTQSVDMDGSMLTIKQNGYTLTYERQ